MERLQGQGQVRRRKPQPYRGAFALFSSPPVAFYVRVLLQDGQKVMHSWNFLKKFPA